MESLKDRVETIESRETVTDDKIKHLVNKELAEHREVEARRLNLICLNLPESKNEDSQKNDKKKTGFEVPISPRVYPLVLPG